ncbi:hypothetical protein BC008_44035 [Mastigocoleus testarum BC008]|uniref:Uncharacterized protein n=1 Tax=Mastigocoleus testarum BC008 TaxID=371196 RepID=A0A0V7ZTE2_9CYAN|nr:hypothetical protein BC008_44035 [Mastigocoleus testarum BC008]
MISGFLLCLHSSDFRLLNIALSNTKSGLITPFRMREGSVGGVGSMGGNPKEYKGVLKIGFGMTMQYEKIFHSIKKILFLL